MLQLIFSCQCDALQSAASIDLMQKDIWRRCQNKDIAGFLLRDNRSFIGVFEGQDKAVVAEVEHLIRKHKVEQIKVVRETSVKIRSWTVFHTRFKILEDVPFADEFDLVGLAQNAKDAVEAERRNN